MRHHSYLLLLSISAIGLGYLTTPASAQMPSPTMNFLQCVGLTPMNMSDGQNNTQIVEGVLAEFIDVYTFLRSSFQGGSILELIGSIQNASANQQPPDSGFIKMWFQVNLRPLLSTVSKEALSCLSMGNFTCGMYQTIVNEISLHFSSLTPAKQKLIYKYFMYPFLARNSTAGCVSAGESSEVWLQRNFGPFSAVAQFKDFIALKMDFSGLEVLHLLTPEQKAELLLHPEMGHLDNETLSLVFDSLIKPLLNQSGSANSTVPTPGPSQPDAGNLNGILKTLQPLGSFIKHLVSFTLNSNVTTLRSYQLAQAVLNYSLSEIAAAQPKEVLPTALPLPPGFNASSLDDWFQHVVIPLIHHFLPQNETIPPDLLVTFSHVFFANSEPEPTDPLDICQLVDPHPCALANTVETLAKIFECVNQTNLTVQHLSPLAIELTTLLSPVIQQRCTMNVGSDLCSPLPATTIDSFPSENFQDVNFTQIFFQTKIKPALPTISGDSLQCLATKNFSCQSYQALVMELSNQMQLLDQERQMLVYTNFIYPFLSQKTSADPSCISLTNSSHDWVMMNFGRFSIFAQLQDFFSLNSNFSAVEVIDLLSPRQAVQLLEMPHVDEHTVNAVLDRFLGSPNSGQEEFLRQLVMLSPMNCSSIPIIMKRLRHLLSSTPGHLEPAIWANINALMHAQPGDCMMMPVDEKCPSTPWNESSICSGVPSPLLDSAITGMPCNFTITQYACSSLASLTGENLADLLTCSLSGDTTYPKETWKLFLTKASGVLDEALLILTNRSVQLRSPPVLEVIGELRIDTLSEAQLQTVPVVHHLFRSELRTVLSSASARFLSCLSSKNFTCETYQQVVNEFGFQFPGMEETQQRQVLEYFILPFLTQNDTSDPSCLNSTTGSEDWLNKNLQQYSTFVPVQQLLKLNPNFDPVTVLSLLSPRQTAELFVLPHPTLSDKKAIANAVFDFFMESPNDKKMVEFLQELLMLSEQMNLSCDSYKTIVSRLDQAVSSGSSELQANGTEIRGKLVQQALLHCPINEVLPGCPTTQVNESKICAGANNSSAVRVENTTMMCENDLGHYACLPMPTNLTSEHVARILSCSLRDNVTYSKETWKLFFTKVSGVLHEALVIFSNMTHSLSRASAMPVLDVIAESLDAGITNSSEDVSLITKIFQETFKPLLPFISQGLLSCLSTKNFSCQTFEVIVRTLSEKYEEMDQRQQSLVYTDFIQVFLSRTDIQDPGCVRSSNGSVSWLQMNFGKFAGFLNLRDIRRLNANFSVLEALPLLTVKQLAEVAATPGQLVTAGDANRLMSHVPGDRLGMFFDEFSPAIQGQPLPAEVRSAMLQQVLDRANLSAASDAEVLVWLQRRLPAVVPNLREQQVAPLFGIVRHRDCNISQEVVKLLSDVRPTLGNGTEREVNRNILLSLREPMPLRCYANQSFYLFVKESFLEFPTPQLSTFLSLMPPNRQAALINSIPPPELGKLLKGPMFIDNSTALCTLLRPYTQTPSLLEQEVFPDNVSSQILPCVWPLALKGVSEAEVSRWFDVRLHNYIRFLNKDLISSHDTLNASCLAFKKLVFTLGSNFDFNSTDIREDGVYNVIKTYLSTDGSPKCYSPSDPTLNSTAWFFNYFHNFIRFANSDDFDKFGSEKTLQVFSVNPQNIQLFSQPGIQGDVNTRYTEYIFQQDPLFSPIGLPPLLQCHVPGAAYSRLDENQTLAVLGNLNQSCTTVEPTISASLAGNIKRISPEVLTALGREVTGLSVAQLSAAPPGILIGSLKQLGKVSGWSQAQSITIVNVLIAGNYQTNSPENLLNLGSLIGGCPSSSISSIPPAVARETASNPEFVTNLLSAPPVVRQTFVSQIIKVDAAPQVLLDNVPDELATEIPRNLLSFPPIMDPAMVQKINKKHWKPEQAALFFDSVAAGTSNADEISTDVLQGFSCTRIQTFGKEKVKNVIRACRRRNGRSKVVLRESQLTCMNNHIKKEKPQNFSDFPSDMLLYYDYSNVQQATCKSYFTETGNADFNVLSEALSRKKVDLLNNARSCLGITGTHLNSEHVEVLGNMCCTLDESYINASDPMILEKLKNCQSFSGQQVTAMETVLLRGTTKYGNPSEWNSQTLESLGPLPANLGNSFWSHFRKRDITGFLRNMRKQDKQERRKLKTLFKELQSTRFRRAADQCTVGNITQVTISDNAFPFGYDATQFDNCLSVEVVRDNLAGLAAKVDVDEFQKIVLNKINQAYPSGLSDQQVQILGPLSRVASVGDINKWNVTTIDSLAALMDSGNGAWEPAKSKAIITKYLGTVGNTLGTRELNAIGGPNLCSVPTSVLTTIALDSLKNANPLNVTACPEGVKNELFSKAAQAFNSSNPVSLTTYQLIQPYLGGAPKDYILRLSRSNVSMDLETFTSLNSSIVPSLNVMDVKTLLGANVDDLKTYENMTIIQAWIRSQDQSALDSLGLNLTGGRAPATTARSPTSAARPGNTTSIKTTTKRTTTASGHDGTSPPSAHQLSLFLGLIFVVLQLLK
ncbi:uncharacterized protein LOC135244255 [Anguilla rostrata]|uniref:uncharacterized protein LOC135244255 n=1 Tax=Anguilla rostrata TaxID=7938 RepID=UPI0030CB42CD